MITIRF